MQIKSIHVKNFRSIFDATVDCHDLTALVGPNGSGKSTFLHALEVFYGVAPKIGPEDFYAGDVDNPIEITVTFHVLDAEETERFQPYMQANTLSVTRLLRWGDQRLTSTLHGSKLQNHDFAVIRQAGAAREIRAKYDEIKVADAAYGSLPKAPSKEAVLTALETWETAHPEKCQPMRDDGQFFGFTGVGKGYLGQYTRFIFVPAVRNAADDAAESRGGVLTELMDLIVRNALAEREDLVKLRADTQKRYDEIMGPEHLNELNALQSDLTGTLKTYVPNSRVLLEWDAASKVEIPLPNALVKLEEDGYQSSVTRTGHGLQRAFVLTMLQHLAVAQRQPVASAELQPARLPDLVLAIEEPELYQHPARQRHIANMLLRLATGNIPGVAKKTQVIYCTHSPLFIGLDRFDQVRLLSKEQLQAGRPKATRVVAAHLDAVAQRLWQADGQQGPVFTGDSLKPRLHVIMTPWMNEGFFARLVVLVEGEDDRSAILGAAAALGHDLQSLDVAVIPCMGKSNIDRPSVIFGHLGIKTYLVWDSDKGSPDPKVKTNRALLRLVDHPEEDYPAVVTPRFACFEKNLEVVLQTELTPGLYNQLMNEEQLQWEMPRNLALKNPYVVQSLLSKAYIQGAKLPTFEDIVNHIIMAVE